jgi:signal transduction histidine kinase
LENVFSGLTKRYPEVEELYVVFFEPGRETETWQALTFVPHSEKNRDINYYKGKPIGRLVNNKENSDSILRTWQSIETENMTKLYAAFDPRSIEKDLAKQYFIHTVFEAGTEKPDNERERVGLLVFSANPKTFPSKTYFAEVITNHQKHNILSGNFNYSVLFKPSLKDPDFLSSGSEENSQIKSFNTSDKLFPNIFFSVSAQKTSGFGQEYFQSSILLGIIAAIIAIIGLLLTWRAAQSEMKIARLKSEFLANISHELKTPLTSIRAFGDLIYSGRSKNSERIREYGGIIKTESDRLTQIINDILEMSRLEKGVRRFNLKENNLSEIALQTVDFFRHSPKAKGFEIKVKIPQTPVRIECDEGAVKQAILNLLSNAVKYSKPGTDQKIEFSLEIKEENAVIKVKDFGVGISMADQKKIFVPFQRSERNKIQSKGGTGLGLAITKEIITGHLGQIFVESEIEKGSTFIIHLPILKERTETEEIIRLEAGDNGTYLGYRG